ncbi:MAG: alpha/beta fold hydrolase [Verrucomicrobiota bacterium]
MRLFYILGALLAALSVSAEDRPTVVLIHGLAASGANMWHIEETLDAEGYRVLNVEYPSMSYSLEELAPAIRAVVDEYVGDAPKIHFVTHSMGGILLRMIQRDDPIEQIGRVVMLAPPNHGSYAVNVFEGIEPFESAIGPAGLALRDGDNAFLEHLGTPDFEFGVLAGSRGVDPIFSTMIPGPDDGVVSVESTKLEGMSDFKVIHVSHPMIVIDAEAMDNIVAFLQTGEFLEQTKDRSAEHSWRRQMQHRPRLP